MSSRAGLRVERRAAASGGPWVVPQRGAEPHAVTSMPDFWSWWDERGRAGAFCVESLPWSRLDRWSFDPTTGNLGHDSGRFFTVEGLRARRPGLPDFTQPVIHQPEIGILGILFKEFDGVLHCLMQAKMEPGNINTLQLSPTVQATRSNYTQVHRGAPTRHLEHFVRPGHGEVLVDVLQSEQGGWFWRKRNRNMVVLATREVTPSEDHIWLSLGQVYELLQVENLVNMDARTVLSCLPLALPDEHEVTGDGYAEALARSYGDLADGREGGALRRAGEVRSWLTDAKTRCDWDARLVPLSKVTGWSCTDDEISDDTGSRFRIVAVQVEARTREVTRWSQPLLAPREPAEAVLVTRIVDGVLHALVRAKPEYGLVDLVEMAPTVHRRSGAEEPGELDEALVGVGATRFDSVLSEEGGRFWRALTRYRITEVGEEVPVDLPPDYCWVTARQVTNLLRHGHYLNVEARTLMACLHSLW